MHYSYVKTDQATLYTPVPVYVPVDQNVQSVATSVLERVSSRYNNVLGKGDGLGPAR